MAYLGHVCLRTCVCVCVCVFFLFVCFFFNLLDMLARAMRVFSPPFSSGGCGAANMWRIGDGMQRGANDGAAEGAVWRGVSAQVRGHDQRLYQQQATASSVCVVGS